MTPPQRAEPFVVLGMYPFPALREAWSLLYAAAAERARQAGVEAPSSLCWDREPHDTWLDPQLALGMTCGWPLATSLRDRVRVVGTFTYRSEPAPQPQLYRTVVIAREDSPLAEFAGRPAAINSADSLSGNVSLLDAFGLGPVWDGPVTCTGSHQASIEAVRTGVADVASIDAMTWTYAKRDAPASLGGLFVVGRGPWVPGLPVIVQAAAGDAVVEIWRGAFAQAIVDPALASAADRLLIDDFVPLDLADYDAALAHLRHRHEASL